MSLQHAAKHLESKGRNGDDMLVHMTKGEVKSLQDLAKAHGGSLTINPETGLPEAGFLRAIMPTVIGATVTAATGNPYIGASAAAAYGYSETGTITGGLMAGVQGYGGAGLAEGMTTGAAGTQLAAGEAADIAAQQEAARLAQQEAVRQQVTQQALNTSQNAGLNELAVHAGEDAAKTAFGEGLNTTFVPPAGGSGVIDPLTQSQLSSFPEPYNQMQMNRFVGVNGGAYTPTNLVPPPGASNLGYANMDPNYANAASGVNTGATGAQMDAMTNGQYGGPAAKSNWDILAKNATAKNLTYAFGPAVLSEMMQQRNNGVPNGPNTHGTGDVYEFTQGPNMSGTQPISPTGVGQSYFPQQGYRKKGTYSYAAGGPVEQMSNQSAIGANTGYPQADVYTSAYSVPSQSPVAQNIVSPPQDMRVDPHTGAEKFAMGGISDAAYNLGGYSDGGRLLRGPGDGVSDSIPAVIGKKQPARLADGEFVVPARIVSELGNGSTEAGARKLYAMMDRVQKARGKTVGKGKVATNTKADKNLPA